VTPDLDNFQTLFVMDTPLLDVRSPIEFAKGSLPTAINAPLMEDSEREAVGICYEQSGQAAAVQLGHELVTGALKEARVARWKQFAEANPHGALFCFRGGLRSEITQQWLAEAGINYPRIKGGYKSLRQWLSQKTETIIASTSLLLVGGQTGVAKTRLLNEGNAGRPIPGSIDLEGLANHRGSAFGRRITAQPTQIAFELAVGVALVQYQTGNHRFLILEDEGRLIGRCALPPPIHASRGQADWVRVEATLSERVNHSYDNYILGNLQEYMALGEPRAFEIFSKDLIDALERIRKRLGGKRHTELNRIMLDALTNHRQGDPEQHKLWIEALLTDYYDPMYEHQMRQRALAPIFQGTQQEVTEFLLGLAQQQALPLRTHKI
jgi:tRNA 2-selenouridine synthase